MTLPGPLRVLCRRGRPELDLPSDFLLNIRVHIYHGAPQSPGHCNWYRSKCDHRGGRGKRVHLPGDTVYRGHDYPVYAH